MPLRLLDSIFNRLRKPEIILTFAYDALVTWVQDFDRLNHHLRWLGLDPVDVEEFEAAARSSRGYEALIQRKLHRAFLRAARYYTPFFITSRESNMAFWLVHLSVHARARDVMTGLHWELQNHFAHFGGPGHNMLGYDPAQPPPASQPYLFDEDARSRTVWSLQDQLPGELLRYPDGVTFRDFFADVANGSPADSRITREALIALAEARVVEIRTEGGSAKRSNASLKPTDRLLLPAQPSLFLPTGPVPVFARQPGSNDPAHAEPSTNSSMQPPDVAGFHR